MGEFYHESIFAEDFDFNSNALDLLTSCSKMQFLPKNYEALIEQSLCRFNCNYPWLWLDNLILVQNNSSLPFRSLDNVVYVFVFGATNPPQFCCYSTETEGGSNGAGFHKISYKVSVTNNIFAAVGDVGIVHSIQVLPPVCPNEIVINLNVSVVKI